MAHYAFINEHNVVTEVIVGRDEDDLADGVTSWETYYGNIRSRICLRTSYNTYRDENGVPQHYSGGTPFRGQYAGIGDIYDVELDEFVSPIVEE
jgi:hypothetical protein